MRYIECVTDMSTKTLIRCHQNAFWYFGGYPEEILYDNMKQVVSKRLLKQEDSTLNRQFEDFAGFYSFKPILCRPYRGQTKGKVERTVQFVRDNFGVSVWLTIEFPTCQHFVAYLLRGLRQETPRRRVWTGISQQMRPELG